MQRKTVFSAFSRAPYLTASIGVCAVVAAFTDVAVKQFLGTLVDAVGGGTINGFPWLTVTVTALVCLGLKLLQPYLDKLLSERLRISFYGSLGERSLYGKQARLESVDLGQLTTSYTSDVSGVCACVDRIIQRGIPDVFLFAFSVFALMRSHVWLGVAAIAASVLPFTAMFFVSKILVSAHEKLQRSFQTMNTTLTGDLGSLEYVKANNLEEFVSNKSKADLRGLERAKRKVSAVEAIVGLPMLLCPFITVFAVAAVGGYLVIGGTLGIGQLFAAVTLTDNVVAPVMRFDNTVRRIRRGNVCMARLEQILGIENECGTAAVKTVAADRPLTLSARDLCFSYENGRSVFLNSSFSFSATGLNALVGENGVGKSTFIKLLCGVATPDSGNLLLEGADLPPELSTSDLRKTVIVDPQQPLFFPGTLRECLTQNESVTDEKIMALCKAVGLGDDFMTLPDGLDTVMAEDGGFLSGGQKRRVSFVGAMLREGLVYIFDEPTAGVDDENAEKMIGLLLELAARRLVIAISHDPRLISRAANVVRLEVNGAHENV